MQFSEWLLPQLSKSSVKKYTEAIDGPLSEWAAAASIVHSPLSSIREPSEFRDISSKISMLPIFIERNGRGHHMYSSALNKYQQYLDQGGSASSVVNDLKPNAKNRLIDCVSDAGIDVSDWSDFAGKNPASNPKYCYEWSFRDNDIVVINIWYVDITKGSGGISASYNLRQIANERDDANQKKRALAADENIKFAYEKGYLVRVIIQTGDLSVRHDPEIGKAKTVHRQLDSKYWEVADYSNLTGEFKLIRIDDCIDFSNKDASTHNKSVSFFSAPSFDLATCNLRADSLPSMKGKPPPLGKKNPARKAKNSSARERSPLVRRWLLDNTGEACECCNKTPFRKADGTTFREVHHIKRLADDGSDSVENAIAVCANCHRELHFGVSRDELVESLYVRIPRLKRE